MPDSLNLRLNEGRGVAFLFSFREDDPGEPHWRAAPGFVFCGRKVGIESTPAAIAENGGAAVFRVTAVWFHPRSCRLLTDDTRWMRFRSSILERNRFQQRLTCVRLAGRFCPGEMHWRAAPGQFRFGGPRLGPSGRHTRRPDRGENVARILSPMAPRQDAAGLRGDGSEPRPAFDVAAAER